MTDKAYHGLPYDTVLEIGKIAIAGTALEEAVYLVAEALNIHGPRGMQGAKEAAKAVRALVGEVGVPWWANTTAEQLTAWIVDAINALDRRGNVVHQRYMRVMLPDGLVTHGRRTNRKQESRPVSAERLVKTREELDRVYVLGMSLFLGLLMETEDGVYTHVFGPDAVPIVAEYMEGEWPARLRDEDLANRRAEFLARLQAMRSEVPDQGPEGG